MNSALYAGLLSCRLSKSERCQHHGNAGNGIVKFPPTAVALHTIDDSVAVAHTTSVARRGSTYAR